MQKNENKPVILGEKTAIMLWGFRVILEDRRTGGAATNGYIVVTGNEEYDLEAAEAEIRNRYGRLGYNVTACTYDETRVFNYDAIEAFKQSRCNRCGTCEYYIRPDDSRQAEEQCSLAIGAEREGDEETKRKLDEALSNRGIGCVEYEKIDGRTREKEDEPDFLEECMAALAELEEKR